MNSLSFFSLPADILDTIYGFSDSWKTRFTNDVLPKINKGNKIVGLTETINGPGPCGNCYLYADTACGNGTFCMNCERNPPGAYTTMDYAEYKAIDGGTVEMRMFETYEDFCRWMNIEKLRINNDLPELQQQHLLAALLKKELHKKVVCA